MTCSLSFAFATNGKNKKEETKQEQEKPKQQITPQEETEPENGGNVEKEPPVKADTAQNSFRKFNFIFYFLYKHKYENDPEFRGCFQQNLVVINR